MRLDIYSDTICPWCFIGLRRLQKALDAAPRPDLNIRWRTFQLNPGMPEDGMDRARYLELKFGGRDRAQQVYASIEAAGRSEDIPFRFDRIGRTPNTLDSHRLLRLAEAEDRQTVLAEAMFEAYFLDGRDIGDQAVLVELATASGLDPEFARARLASDWGREETQAEDEYARSIGISGVPCFIVDGKYAVSGAQGPDVLNKLFDVAVHGEPADAAPGA